MSEAARHRLTAGALGAALLLLAVCTGLRKIRAPDYWWHLSAGRWIAETGSVPKVDVFTYTVPGAPWLDIHWLFQLGLAGVQALGGHEGVVVAKAALVALLVAILATVGWRRERPFVTALGLGLMLLAANERFLARPELTSFVLLGAILALLERHARRRDAWVYAIVPLQLLWVNTHGLFALGVVVCAIYAVAEAVRTARGQGQGHALRRLMILTLLVLLSSLANPNFLDGALYPLEQLGMISPVGGSEAVRYRIVELVPLWQPGLPVNSFVAPGVLALLWAIALLASWRDGSHREEHALAFLAFVPLFVMASRNAAVFAVVAAPLFVHSANEWLDRHPPRRRVSASYSAAVLILLLAASWDVARGSFYARIQEFHEPGIGTIDLFVAEGAADWIERERPPGRIAHSMVFGGYLNWRLHPDYPVMVDGRLEVYGPAKLAELRLSGPRAFVRLDAQYRFGSVVLSPTLDPPELIAWLHQHPGWSLVHVDLASVLFVRVDPDGGSPWPAIDVHAPGLLPEPKPRSPMSRYAYSRARHRLQAALGLEVR